MKRRVESGQETGVAVSVHGALPGACLRCKHPQYRALGAEALINAGANVSQYVGVAWLALEKLMSRDDVHAYVLSRIHTQQYKGQQRGRYVEVKGLWGPDRGFVSEVHIVPRKDWPGAVDIYVPWLHLAVQVDGEHHDSKCDDADCVAACKQHGVNLLRLHWSDKKYFEQHLEKAFWACLHNSDVLSAGTYNHPLVLSGVLTRTTAIPVGRTWVM